jgi:drug/metabolite transporter (DMT)-like permease
VTVDRLAGRDLAAVLVVVVWSSSVAIVPVAGLAAGMLVLGEVITPWQWAGIALVVAALACVMLGGMVRRR